MTVEAAAALKGGVMRSARVKVALASILLLPMVISPAHRSLVAHAAQPALPSITVIAIDPQASEKGRDTGAFLLKRTGGAMHEPLVVGVALSGSAKIGADYSAPPYLVRFPRNVSSAEFVITPESDALREGSETVTLEIEPTNYYLTGAPKQATITIADATGGGSKPATPKPSNPASPQESPTQGEVVEQDPGTPIGRRASEKEFARLPVGTRRSGSLVVTMTFDGTGHWSNASTGAHTTTIAHRKIEYTVPLEGMYAYGAGFHEIDRREEKSGMIFPIPNRFLVLRPRIGSAGSPCGRGTVDFIDRSRGMTLGDPGMPRLVPFKREIRGGGQYPTRDQTVSERDLCQTAVTIDFGKQVIHLRLDGSDTEVKVKDIYDGRHVGTYNRVLHGRDGGHAKRKLTFFDWPLPDRDAPEGYRVIENFIMESGPEHSTYPLTAKVQWKLTMDQNGW